MELGESIADAAVREVEEETGLTVELIGLVGIYTDPGHVMAYYDGEVRQEFSVCFHARVVGGKPREDGSETKEVRWGRVHRRRGPQHPPVHAPTHQRRSRRRAGPPDRVGVRHPPCLLVQRLALGVGGHVRCLQRVGHRVVLARHTSSSDSRPRSCASQAAAEWWAMGAQPLRVGLHGEVARSADWCVPGQRQVDSKPSADDRK